MTERRSMMAERDTTDRYLAAWLADRVGAEFEGTTSGIARFGLFVKLDETGADGLVPISSLGTEYFRYDPDTQTLTGERSRRVIGLGQRVTVRLAEAVPDHRRPPLRAPRDRGPPDAHAPPPRRRGPPPQARPRAATSAAPRRSATSAARAHAFVTGPACAGLATLAHEPGTTAKGRRP